VDDFVLRRGHVYATVLVDAATGQAIDILPGREAGPLADWLKAHPGAQVICRDRAGAYAEGARDGAPEAVQVADRWHLWHNLAEHTAKAVARHRACLKQIAAAADQPQRPPAPAETLTEIPAPGSRLAARMRDKHAAVQALAARGLGLRAIARELGVLNLGCLSRLPSCWARLFRQRREQLAQPHSSAGLQYRGPVYLGRCQRHDERAHQGHHHGQQELPPGGVPEPDQGGHGEWGGGGQVGEYLHQQ
jgi:hypothetical protein